MIRCIVQKLLSARNVLIMTHLRPDGDALGSSFGLRQFLRDNGISAEVIIPMSMPNRYRSLCHGELTAVSREEFAAYDLAVTVDCANSERLGCGSELSLEYLKSGNFINIDHHKGNSLDVSCALLDPEAASACTIVAEILLQSGREISPQCATFLLSGMMTDTGCFCFANTNGRALRTAAAMTDCGADVEKIANNIFFNKELNQLRFESELTGEHLKTACNGKFAYMYIPETLLEKYHFDLKEDEGLIDIVRSVSGTVIAMLCHRRQDGFRVSLRSKNKSFPVGSIARQFGGGGHEMAAGCTIEAADFSTVEKIMLQCMENLFNA